MWLVGRGVSAEEGGSVHGALGDGTWRLLTIGALGDGTWRLTIGKAI